VTVAGVLGSTPPPYPQNGQNFPPSILLPQGPLPCQGPLVMTPNGPRPAGPQFGQPAPFGSPFSQMPGQPMPQGPMGRMPVMMRQ